MATLWKSYPSTSSARAAVAVLKAGGVPSRHTPLVAGAPQHDLRDEPVGEFAGTSWSPMTRRTLFGIPVACAVRGRAGFAGDPTGSARAASATPTASSTPGRSHDAGSQHAHVSGYL